MDFKTVAMKENTITTAAKDDAADLTENDDVPSKLAIRKTKKPFMKSYTSLHSSYIWSPGVPDILENFNVVPNILGNLVSKMQYFQSWKGVPNFLEGYHFS